MDKWQGHVYDKVSAFTESEFEYSENEVTISLNQREAYVVLKALEYQQRHLNQPRLIKFDENGNPDGK